MKLHLVGLPHTQTTRAASVCAFTQKLVKFGKMMTPLGYEVIVYSGEENETICSEHVPLFTNAEQRSWYGNYDANTLPSVATWNSADDPWVTMNGRAIAEISKRLEPHDLILITAGLANRSIAQAFPGAMVVEWAAGYSGIFADYVCFESYAWMHYLYGVSGRGDGRWYDTVIPNFFDLDEWKPQGVERGDYLLYTGRLIQRKGVEVAAAIAQRVGMPLWVAGSGMDHCEDGVIVCQDGSRITGDVHYHGTVGGDERTALMQGAKALIAPTIYIEPFGAVAVEAQLCGTPVITTDWGAFPETVTEGLSGYRFRTLKEGADAVAKALELDRDAIAQHARANYSLEAIGPRYDAWFQRLEDLWRAGWYE